MKPDRWDQVERIYHAALEQPPELRATFVASQCRADRELRSEVESLLAVHEEQSEFLETPVLQEAAARLADGTALLTAGGRVGRYHVTELLAVGGMGEVYRAWDPVLERDVALKVLRDTVDRPGHGPLSLRREGQAAARLTHPAICTVHEVDRCDGRSYLVLEYVEGRTLAQVLAASPLPAERVLRYGIEIADALAHAHEKGVLHKDLKSSNVMITESDHVKVVDFGIARRLTRSSVEALTRGSAEPSHVLVGTPAYMSPELLRGQTADEASDLWALGVLLHEMASGELPFAGHTEFELAAAILDRPPRPLPDTIPRPLRQVLDRCLNKEPAARFASAAEIREVLAGVYTAAGYRLPTPGPRTAAEPGVARGGIRPQAWPGSRGRRAALAAVLVAGLGVGWWALDRSRDRPLRVVQPDRVPMLAVMPVPLKEGGDDAEHLSVGLADGVHRRIAAVPSLRVRPPGAVSGYRHGNADLSTMTRDLALTHVLYVTARRVGDRCDITLRLVRTADESTVWRDTLAAESRNLMNVEEQIADRVVRALNVELDERERARLARQGTRNAAAYDEYLKGRSALVRTSEDAVGAAVAAFEKALEHDPLYADALAGLAMALVRTPWHAGSPAERATRYEEAMRAAGRATQLAPSLAEAHEAVAAVYRYMEFGWETVIAESERALQLSPSLDLPHFNLSVAFYHLGLFTLADRAARAGLAANPRSQPEAVRNQGRSALYDGRFETAAKLLAHIERTSDDGPRWMLAEAWYYLGEHERSVNLLRQVERSTSLVMRERASASLAAVLASRDRAGAERRLRTLTKLSSPDHHVSHRIGTAYAQLRQADTAVRWLRQAANTGFPCYAWFDEDPLLDPIRSQPVFEAFLGELRPKHDLWRNRYGALADRLF